MNIKRCENTSGVLEKALEESLAYLRTLASFGGTLIQSKELAQKGITKVEEILKDESSI